MTSCFLLLVAGYDCLQPSRRGSSDYIHRHNMQTSHLGHHFAARINGCKAMGGLYRYISALALFEKN